MQRRFLLAAMLVAASARAEEEAPPRPRQKISAGQLYEALSARFPLRLGVQGLLQLQVSAPRLLLLPARNKLGAALVAQADAQGARALPPGEMELVFGLRYEASDRTVRAHQPEVLGVHWPGMPPETAQLVQAVVPAMLRDNVGEIVLHRFATRELALPETMGFVPDRLTVLEDGLLVEFAPKPSG